jgi:hypothetical protein
VLPGAVEDEVGDLLKDVGWSSELIEGVKGVTMRLDCSHTCFFYPVQSGIRRFIRSRILARRLPESFRCRRHVKKVIGDLKQEPQV